MRTEILIEDMVDNVHRISDYGWAALELWFRQFLYDDESISQEKIEDEIKIQLQRALRGAIEGVTNIQPEWIIIDLEKDDSRD